MQVGTQEHLDLISAFEKHMKTTPIRCRLDKEQRTEWRKGRVFQDMNTNDLFRLYCAGYANARCVYFQLA